MLNLLADMEQPHPGRLSLVVSSNPDAGGLVKAKDMGVFTEVVDYRLYHSNRSAFEAALQAVLSAHEIDVVCLAGFMRILGEEFVSAWHRRILNIHPSLLPKYQGLNTYQRALDAGDTEAGCTVHEVVPALDAGPILGQSRVAILPGDTADDLAARTLIQEHRLYPIVLRDFLTRFELQS
jgi:phosphoribosylglycinamide formyltransferase-1